MARSSPRYLPEGALVEVTVRVLHSLFLLRPSPSVNQIVRGVFARAQERYGVEVHAFNAMSNHMHLLLSPGNQRDLSGFMRYVNSNIARKIGRLHGWRERFWARRYQAIVVSDEDEAQLARMRYMLEQGPKEGLVASPELWPGANSVQALLDGDERLYGVWHDATAEYFDRKKGKMIKAKRYQRTEVLFLTPLPALRHLSKEAQRGTIRAMVEDIREQTRLRHEANGTRPLGVPAILSQDPYQSPHRSKRSPAPAVHAVTRKARRLFFDGLCEFRRAYRAAAERLRKGLSATFPPHCFPPSLPYTPATRGRPPDLVTA